MGPTVPAPSPLRSTRGGRRAPLTVAFGRVGYFPGDTMFSVNRRVTVRNAGVLLRLPDPTYSPGDTMFSV